MRMRIGLDFGRGWEVAVRLEEGIWVGGRKGGERG